MKTFKEWKTLKEAEFTPDGKFLEALGFEDDPNVESLDDELYGIRETLKNALAGNTLSYQWGGLGLRIRKLAERGVDKKQHQKVVEHYQFIADTITNTVTDLQRFGVTPETQTSGNKTPIEKGGRETVGDRVREVLSYVNDIFVRRLGPELDQMGSASHSGL
jgi:hypothetical protein